MGNRQLMSCPDFSNYFGDELTINALIQNDYYPTRFVKEPGMERRLRILI
jgi:hypothetical protein